MRQTIKPGGPRFDRPSSDYKALYRKLERTLENIERMGDTSRAISACLEALVGTFSDDLGFVGGRIYEREGSHYVLRVRHGRAKTAAIGYRIPATYRPIQELLRKRVIIMRRQDEGFDPNIEGPIGVSKFAAFGVGDDNRYIVSLSIKGPIDEEHTLYALNAVRHIINMKLRQQHLNDIVHEARRIQISILPIEPPRFEGFDIFGVSHPADLVGGDLFDYIPQSSRLLGVAVADASGHGLPAALQARDVITGLRMGMEESLKIITAIERLNRVIYKSRLGSRFVSLFYGEIESNGNLIYCNAGHPPALLLHKGDFTELSHGGLVLGPNPGAQYERGFAMLEPGDYLVMYTDGLTEATSPGEEEYGIGRLESVLKQSAGRTARAVVQAVLQDLATFAGRAPQIDDRTLVVVRRQ